MHESYGVRLNHKADFRVKYRFRSPEEGGRKSGPAYQGIRCDFSIVGETRKQQYQIWPEFEDASGDVIQENNIQVPKEGTARMWIIRPEMRPFHYDKIQPGLKCNFREGALYSADCEVIEILDLKVNPVKSNW